MLEFHGPHATTDRYLFPPHTIVESLGTKSILASFLVFRKGSEAEDKSLFDPDIMYFEPVTVKIDVQEKHREILQYMQRSVKPAEEVREWMEEKMRTCKRADMRFLAMRLPHKSQIPEEDEMALDSPAQPETKKVKTVKKEKVTVREVPREDASMDQGRRRSVKKSVRISEGVAM